MARIGFIVLVAFLVQVAHTASGQRQAQGPNFEAGLPLRQSNDKSIPQLWPRGKVPYSISSSIVDDAKIRAIKEPMRDIESHTCIKFVNRRSESEYLNIQTDRAACSAQVGMQTGINQMNLADACYDYPTIALNLLYALGLYPENNRNDRDTYVEINNENLRGLNQRKFEKASQAPAVLETPYDFRSLTHFPEQAFGIKKGPRDWTIRAKKTPTTQLGNNKISSGDFQKLNALYCGGSSRRN